MTTLKHYHADEIAKALDAQLRDEGFTGMYRKADARVAPGAKTQWWKGPAGAEFKAKVDSSKTQRDIDVALNMLNDPDFKTRLGKEGVTDETELQNYANAKANTLPEAADDKCCPKCGKMECECQMAADGHCPEHADAQDGCPTCAADGQLAVAIDFAIRHMVKVADALDKTGFVGVAGAIDETLRKLASARPAVTAAAKDRPPKKWWDKVMKDTKADKKYKGYSKERLSEIVGGIWQKLSDKEKEKTRREYA
jgi:hypothetical protein